MNDEDARSTRGTFIIQSSYGAGPKARKYRGPSWLLFWTHAYPAQ